MSTEKERQERPPKVFGVGCPRTGTTTLHRCMEILGYHHISWSKDLFQQALVHGEMKQVFEVAKSYDSFDDLPWCALYKELDQAFPGSRFILTIRKDSHTWLQSRFAHAERMGHALAHDGSEPVADQAARGSIRWPQDVQHYEQHNQEVHAYFVDRPKDLLVLCWETGDGWRELCTFLGVPVPKIRFPHANKSSLWLRSKVALRSWLSREG